MSELRSPCGLCYGPGFQHIRQSHLNTGEAIMRRFLLIAMIGCICMASVGCVTHFSKTGEQSGDFKRDYLACLDEVERSDYAVELATGQRVELLFGPTRLQAMRVDCMKVRGWTTQVTHAFVTDKTNTIQGSWGEP